MSVPADVPAALLMLEDGSASTIGGSAGGEFAALLAESGAAQPDAATLSLLEDSGAAVANVRVDKESIPVAVESAEAQLRRAALSLLEDSGAAVADFHVDESLRATLAESGVSRHEALLARLSAETSGFRGGIGLEGKALVNGKEFSWANVNMSNISYG